MSFQNLFPITLGLILIGSFIWKKVLKSKRADWNEAPRAYSITSTILLLAFILTKVITYCIGLSTIAELQTFRENILCVNKYAVSETQEIRVNALENSKAGSFANVFGLAYQNLGSAASKRIVELRDNIESYNKRLNKYHSLNQNWLTKGFVPKLPQELKLLGAEGEVEFPENNNGPEKHPWQSGVIFTLTISIIFFTRMYVLCKEEYLSRESGRIHKRCFGVPIWNYAHDDARFNASLSAVGMIIFIGIWGGVYLSNLLTLSEKESFGYATESVYKSANVQIKAIDISGIKQTGKTQIDFKGGAYQDLGIMVANTIADWVRKVEDYNYTLAKYKVGNRLLITDGFIPNVTDGMKPILAPSK
jgi:hypothetical protein